MAFLRVRCADGAEFELDAAAANYIGLLRNMLACATDAPIIRNLTTESAATPHPQPQASVVPLPNVSGSVFAKILEFVTHHKHDIDAQPPPPTNSASLAENKQENAQQQNEEDEETDDEFTDMRTKEDWFGEWDETFIKCDQTFLFELLLAANYLDVRRLCNLACKTVASMIAGKSTEEMRSMFGVVNDFTPEEEEAIRRENDWLRNAIA